MTDAERAKHHADKITTIQRGLAQPNISPARKALGERALFRQQRAHAEYSRRYQTELEDTALDSVGMGGAGAYWRTFKRRGLKGLFGRASNDVLMGSIRRTGGLVTGAISQIGSQGDKAYQRREQAEELGASNAEMQALDYMATKTGMDKEHLYASVDQVEQSRVAALQGDEESMAAFAQLGVSPNDLIKKSTVDLFTDITRQFESGRATSKQYAAGLALIRDEFEELAPYAEKGLGKGIDDFQKSSLVIDDNTARDMAALGEGRKMLGDLYDGAVDTVKGWGRSAKANVVAGYDKAASWVGSKAVRFIRFLQADVSNLTAIGQRAVGMDSTVAEGMTDGLTADNHVDATTKAAIQRSSEVLSYGEMFKATEAAKRAQAQQAAGSFAPHGFDEPEAYGPHLPWGGNSMAMPMSPVSSDFARQTLELQNEMLEELRYLSDAVRENTHAVQDAFGGR